MPEEKPEALTQLLRRWSDGDPAAVERVIEEAYRELRQIARSHLRRERQGHTMQPTELVNELYLRLARDGPTNWKDRHHFFTLASRIMRRLLIDYARRRNAARRQGIRVSLPSGLEAQGRTDVDVAALDHALTRMEALFPREFKVVELRYFCGMTVEETAEHLGIGTGTVKRDWRFAKGFLYAEMKDAAP